MTDQKSSIQQLMTEYNSAPHSRGCEVEDQKKEASEEAIHRSIVSHPDFSAKEFVNFYCTNHENTWASWRFLRIFGALTFKSQLALIREAFSREPEKRTPFDKILLGKNEYLFYHLSISCDSLAQRIIKFLCYGFSYYVDICRPNEKNKGDALDSILSHIEFMAEHMTQGVDSASEIK